MRRIILIALSLSVVIFAFGQSTRIEILDSLFTALHSKNTFNGNVLIAEQGKIIFQRSYGYADEALKRELDSSSIFELASVSKQFTAMAVFILSKQGKLQFDDPVSKYVPELDFYGNMTITNLLNHTSGLPDYMKLFEEKWDKSKFAINQDIVDELAKYRPERLFPASEKFDYSNTGYAILGLIIERVANMSFEDYLHQHIFETLGMDHTFVYRSRYKPQIVENYAKGYVADDAGKKVLPDSFGKEYFTYYLDGIVGDGMVNSTVGDLLLWDRALYTDQLISKEDQDLIYQSSFTLNGDPNYYSFGWVVRDNDKYGKIANHSGGWAGYITFIERHLTNDKTIILLQNNALPKTKLPVKEIRMILYGEPLVSEQSLTLNAEDLMKYLGDYTCDTFPLKIKVTMEDNILYAQATGQNSIPLEAYANDIFKFDPAGIQLQFNLDEGTFELTQGGMKMTFKRE